MYILFPLRDVHSCTLSSLMLLLVSLLFLLVYLLRFIGVVQNPMVFFFLAFIHRILLDLGLDYFPASKLVHIIARIDATFLKQRAAQLKASSKRPYVESSIGNASLAPPSSDPSTKAYMDPTAIVILHHLHLVTLPCVLCWIRFSPFKLRMANTYWMCSMRLRPYEQSWRLLKVLLHRLHPLMSHDCPLAIHHKMGEYIEKWGEIFFLARLYLGDTHDMYFGYFGFDVFIFLIGCIC